MKKMFSVQNSKRITKYVLLSLLCLNTAFSASIETVQSLGNDEDEGIYGEYEDEGDNAEAGDIIHHDFFRFTTRKRYIWEDWTTTTTYRPVHRKVGLDDSAFWLIVVLPVGVVCIILLIKYLLCSSKSDSNSSTDRHTTVHPPPQRRIGNFAQVHRPPTGRNQYADSRRELFGEPARTDLFSELDSSFGTAHATGATVSFVNPNYSTSTPGRREPDIAVAEKPPDYSTVTLNDLLSPTQPAFPVVKSDIETPPPEYGK